LPDSELGGGKNNILRSCDRIDTWKGVPFAHQRQDLSVLEIDSREPDHVATQSSLEKLAQIGAAASAESRRAGANEAWEMLEATMGKRHARKSRSTRHKKRGGSIRFPAHVCGFAGDTA
jgi:hypothetical protein